MQQIGAWFLQAIQGISIPGLQWYRQLSNRFLFQEKLNKECEICYRHALNHWHIQTGKALGIPAQP